MLFAMKNLKILNKLCDMSSVFLRKAWNIFKYKWVRQLNFKKCGKTKRKKNKILCTWFIKKKTKLNLTFIKFEIKKLIRAYCKKKLHFKIINYKKNIEILKINHTLVLEISISGKWIVHCKTVANYYKEKGFHCLTVTALVTSVILFHALLKMDWT